MNWPEDLIVGGVQRRNGIIVSAEAFQSVFLVAAAADVYQRFKVGFLIIIFLYENTLA